MEKNPLAGLSKTDDDIERQLVHTLANAIIFIVLDYSR